MISQYPVNLSKYGKNPFGKLIWRVVWGPSRTYKIIHRKDNNVSYREVLLYPGTNKWVLERWQSAIQFAGTKESWDRQELDNEAGLGEYPSEGEWSGCYEFNGAPTDAAVCAVIDAILYGQNYSFEQKKQALIAAEEKKENDWLTRAMDIYRDSQGPFRHNPVSGIPGKKKPEDMRLDIGAEDLNIPQKDGAFFQK